MTRASTVRRAVVLAVVLVTLLATGPAAALSFSAHSASTLSTTPLPYDTHHPDADLDPLFQVDADGVEREIDSPVGTTVVGGTIGTSLRLYILNPRPDSRAVIERIEITGPDADEFRANGVDLPLTLTGSTVHNYVAEFRPTSPGEKRAELTVYEADGDVTAVHHLSGRAVPADAHEPNDEFDAATPIASGATVASVLVGADVDTFGIEAVAGQSVTVTVTNDAETDLSYFLARDGQFRVTDVERVPAGESITRTVTASATGTYQILVGNDFDSRDTEAGFSYDVVTPYELGVSVAGAGVTDDDGIGVGDDGTDDDGIDTGDGANDGAGDDADDGDAPTNEPDDGSANEPDDGSANEPDDGPANESDDDPVVESEAGAPGFGAVAVLLALAAVAAVSILRRRGR